MAGKEGYKNKSNWKGTMKIRRIMRIIMKIRSAWWTVGNAITDQFK